MNARELMDNILYALRTVMDDREKLQKVYDFMQEEIIDKYESWTSLLEDKLPINEQAYALVKEVAESIDAGFVCYINKQTREIYTLPKNLNDELFEEDEEFEELMGTVNSWESVEVVEPLPSHESFEIMDAFAEYVPDTNFSIQLKDVLRRKKPFRGFKDMVDDSPMRDTWFHFKEKYLEKYVYELLLVSELIHDEPDVKDN